MCTLLERQWSGSRGFPRKIDPDQTKFVTPCYASNTTQGDQSYQELSSVAHEKGAIMVVDGAQSVPMKIDVQN